MKVESSQETRLDTKWQCNAAAEDLLSAVIFSRNVLIHFRISRSHLKVRLIGHTIRATKQNAMIEMNALRKFHLVLAIITVVLLIITSCGGKKTDEVAEIDIPDQEVTRRVQITSDISKIDKSNVLISLSNLVNTYSMTHDEYQK